jgi:O-antigen/teichoic acid export membrane protein
MLLAERINGWREYLIKSFKSPTVEGTGWLASSSLLNGLIGAVSSAILARLLGIESFGVLVLIVSLYNLLTDVADFGLGSSIVRFGSESIAMGDVRGFRSIVSVVLRLKLVLGAGVLILAAIFLNPIIAYVFDHVDDQITFYFRLALLASAIGIIANIFAPIYQSFKEFRRLSLVSISRYAVKLLIIIGCIPFVMTWSVTLGVTIEIAAVFLFLCTSYCFSPVKKLSLSFSDKQLQRKIFSFNKWISLHQVIALLGGRLDVFFVGGLSDAHALGLYGASAKISGLISMVSYSYLAVLFAEFSASTSIDIIKMKQRHSIPVVLLISVCIALLALLAHPIIYLVFGELFAEAVPVLQIMCVGLVFTVFSYPLTAALFAMNKSTVFPVTSAVALLVFVAGNIYLIPEYGVNGAAIAFSLSGFTSFVVSASWYAGIRRTQTLGG